MSECYYPWCEYHSQDEPFCKLDGCVASAEDLKMFYELKTIQRREQNDKISDTRVG